MNNRFAVGDIALLNDRTRTFKVKIEMPFQDENGEWYYEVSPVGLPDVQNIHREVHESRLAEL